MILPAALGLSVLGGAVHGAFHRNSFVFGRVLGHLPTEDLKVALTFDDGPNPDATPRILDTLGEYGVRATFFVLGRHAERTGARRMRHGSVRTGPGTDDL